jgi:transcriptional regulator with XRE-family HTH domain
MTTTTSVGDMLRRWRQRRELSQLDLASEADVSARHLSFVETGRSVPSREMLLRLAERLEVPLRERNAMLLAAGYAPAFRESGLSDPELHNAAHAIRVILSGHEPYPALAYDKHWTLIDANQAMMRLLEGIADELLRPPVNILRAAMHPLGLASRILNLEEWRAYTLRRLEREIGLTDDAFLRDLFRELSGYEQPVATTPKSPFVAQGQASYTGLVVRLQLAINGSALSFFSASTVLGTPVDITLSELAIESFFPADDSTAIAMRELVPGTPYPTFGPN